MKIKRTLIILGLLILASLGYENKDQIVGGFSTIRGFTTLQSSTILTQLVTISSASFGELATSSIELLPDPGDGKVNILLSVTGYRVFSSESWSLGDIDEQLGLQVGYDRYAITASFSRGFTSGGATSSTTSPSYEVRYPILSQIASPSEAIILSRSKKTTVIPTLDGDTSFKFFVIYRVIDLP